MLTLFPQIIIGYFCLCTGYKEPQRVIVTMDNESQQLSIRGPRGTRLIADGTFSRNDKGDVVFTDGWRGPKYFALTFREGSLSITRLSLGESPLLMQCECYLRQIETSKDE